MHVFQRYMILQDDVPHNDDCMGSVCESCGCCIHCADECPCHGCEDPTCQCIGMQCGDQWCDECYPQDKYSPISVDDQRLTWKQYTSKLLGELDALRAEVRKLGDEMINAADYPLDEQDMFANKILAKCGERVRDLAGD